MVTKDSDTRDVKKQEDLDDITTCCICTEVYTDPKALPCIHTFCMKCLQESGLKTNKGPGDEMPCPLCRRLFQIPLEGFRELPRNYFIESLIQMTNVSSQSASSKALCDTCLEENADAGRDIRVADMLCFDCKQTYCKQCSIHHRKLKLTKNHKLVEINEFDSELTTNQGQSVCELHEQKLLDTYCAQCKTVVCAICFIDDHRHHKGSHVSKFVNDFRKQIESNMQAINECRSKAQTKQRKLLEVKADILERLVKLECDVTNRTDELKKMIDQHATSLIEDLYSIRQSKQKDIQMATDDVDTYLSCLETYNSYCQKIMTKGSGSDICRAFSNLSSRAMELQQECHSVTGRKIQSINLCFRKSKLDEFLQENCENVIGKIEAELRCFVDPVLVRTIRKKSIQKENYQRFRTTAECRSSSGLAILDKELFVVSEDSSEVEVYDSMKLSLSRRWILKELVDPHDIGSCERNKCLYIIDYKTIDQSKEILRVDPDGTLIKKWSTGASGGWIYGLSVTGEATVVVSLYLELKVNEYSPDGQLIRDTNLLSDAGALHPFHAVKLTNGDSMVCGSYRYVECDEHVLGVYTVDAGGKLKKSFSGKCGSTSELGNMLNPHYLHVDRNGFVMVCDLQNCEVLLLDSDLELKRTVISKEKHGIRYPARILLDESNSRLFVADNEANNQRILIFDFK